MSALATEEPRPTVWLTVWPNHTTPAPIQSGPLDWDDHVIATQDTSGWLVCADKRQAQLISYAKFSGPRSKANCVEVTVLGLDYDDELAIEPIIARAAGLDFFAYSTHSHTKEKPRFRILVRLSRPVNSVEWPEFWSAAAEFLGGKPDAQTKDCSRGWYAPCVHPDRAADAFVCDGAGSPLDVDALLASYRRLRGSVALTLPIGRAEDLLGDNSAFINTSAPTPPNEANVRRVIEALTTLDPIGVDDMQRAKPPQERSNYWLPVAMALHSLDWAEIGWRLLDLWSLGKFWRTRQTPLNYNEAENRKRWDSFGKYSGRNTGVGSLFKLAQERGWRPNDDSVVLMPEVMGATIVAPVASTDFARGKNQIVAQRPCAYFTASEWLERDLPAPDFLLGEVHSTTSRLMTVGPTGKGKTSIALAKAFAMASGADFLHWRGYRPACVLFIDGEMSPLAMKERIAEASKRFGKIPEKLIILSRADNEDMPPLNTQAGQDYIDRIIVEVGAEFIFFDNIQALLIGDMKEEDSWAQTLPWIKSLTNRRIGQEWLHHTGHDETRSYGTKTREWQLDTVGTMKTLERPDAFISFELSFPKARHRKPSNRGDFDAINIALVNDAWVFDRIPQGQHANASSSAPTMRRDNAIRALANFQLNERKNELSIPDFNSLLIKCGVLDAAINKGRFTDLRNALIRSGHICVVDEQIRLTNKVVWP